MYKIAKLNRLATAFLVLMLGLGAHTIAYGDSLYIGDGGDDTIKRFDANTGRFLGPLTPPQNTGLLGPRGIIRKGNELLVANQNLNQPFNGEVLRFNKNTLALNGALVPCQDDLGRPCNPDSPFTPLGIIRGPGDKLFVADLFGPSFDPSTEGNVKEYNINDGKFTRNLDHTGFTGRFHPRALVFGPDGLLYVSIRGFAAGGAEGWVLKFNPLSGKFINVFAAFDPASATCSKHLHRPEGLVFGPDGRLYVTSFTTFTTDPDDTDKILVFDRRAKKCIDQINLDKVGEPRTYSQAIVFGPKGKLFVPINTTGEIRRYDVRRKTYTSFVPKAADGGPLTQPWYLSFGETDPRTLEYDD